MLEQMSFFGRAIHRSVRLQTKSVVLAETGLDWQRIEMQALSADDISP